MAFPKVLIVQVDHRSFDGQTGGEDENNSRIESLGAAE
jgi:hypothetical protein